MGDVRALVADPEFASLPLAVRSDALRKVGAPDAFISEYVKLVNKGPMLSSGKPIEGFEDTSKDVANILERRHEPNRARDVLPRLALFAAQGAMAGKLPEGAEAVGAWANALRGASAATKAVAAGKAGVTLAKEGAKFYAANEGMKAIGVPAPIREVALVAAGVTRPGEAARKSLRTLIRGEAAPAAAVAQEVAAGARPAVQEAAAAARLRPGTVGPDGQVVRESLDEVRARWAIEHGTPLPAAAEAVAPSAPAGLRPGTVGPNGQVVRESLDEVKARWALEHGAPYPTEPSVLPAGTRTMPTNLGGAARPGAAPTPPDKLEEALQATLDSLKAKKAAAAAPAENLGTLAAGKPSGALQPERIEVGAEKLGRKVGMTKEEVRMEAGPVLNETRGTASPLLPKQAYASIAEKIKTLPRGEARDAYVKLANSEKAMWNVEAIRRTLETQGLVLPFAAVAGLVIQAQEKD
jgi:hypothetical protein